MIITGKCRGRKVPEIEGRLKITRININLINIFYNSIHLNIKNVRR